MANETTESAGSFVQRGIDASRALISDAFDHTRETWSAVSHGNATLPQYLEAGGEIVLSAAAAYKLGRIGFSRYGARGAAGLETGSVMGRAAECTATESIAWRALTRSEPLAELGAARLPANLTQAGLDLKYQLTADKVARQVTVHLPPDFSPSKPTSVYYLLDGVQVNNPAGNMLGINGWARTADTHNFVAVNLEQSTASSLRIFGCPLPGSVAGRKLPNVTSWSQDFGLINKTRGIDDVRVFGSLHERMQRVMSVEANNIVAFSDGATLANTVAAEMPHGSINGIANVAGTILKDAPAPRSDIRAFLVNLYNDPTIPLEGRAGTKLTNWLPRLGQRHVLRSAPELQEVRYAEANGLLTPDVKDTPLFVQRTYSLNPEDAAKVKAFRLKIGGHTWPGRDTGEGTATALTKANGDTVSHADFPTNNLIVEFFNQGKRILRTI